MVLRWLMIGALLLVAAAHEQDDPTDWSSSTEHDAGSDDAREAALASVATANVASDAGTKARFAGVNICGFDFGCNQQGFCDLGKIDAPLPNVPPTLSNPDNPLNNGTAQMVHFATADNLNVFRLPVSWQYLVNRDLGGPLDPVRFGHYDRLVRGCLATGAYCMVDLHNYARWDGRAIGQGGPLAAQFAALWGELAARYRHDERVWFGLMNEPHGLPSLPAWVAAVQAAVTAIRRAGATAHLISLPGRGHQSPGYLLARGDADALARVANPDGSAAGLVFDVHLYLDGQGAGAGRDCVTSGVDGHWAPLAAWLRANKRLAVLSETGGGDTASCRKYLCQQLRYLE